MILGQLSYAIKNQTYSGLWDEMPPTRGISCLSLVLYGIRIGSEGLCEGEEEIITDSPHSQVT